MDDIIFNKYRQRFEFATNPEAFVAYELRDETVVFTSTKVPKEYEGKGIGSALVKYALDYARDNHWKYQAECPFIKVYIDRHPEYRS